MCTKSMILLSDMLTIEFVAFNELNFFLKAHEVNWLHSVGTSVIISGPDWTHMSSVTATDIICQNAVFISHFIYKLCSVALERFSKISKQKPKTDIQFQDVYEYK